MKLCPKKPQLRSVAVLLTNSPTQYAIAKQLHILYFGLATVILGIWGHVRYIHFSLCHDDDCLVTLFMNKFTNMPSQLTSL